MKDLVSRIQRELPDTDRDRYDIAYERGRAQARSGLLFGGLAFGSLVGALLMWLFDPTAGKTRRAKLVGRATGLRNDLARTTSGRAEDLGNRVEGFAIERGLKEPPTEDGHEDERDDANARWAANGSGFADRYAEDEDRDRDARPIPSSVEEQEQLEPAEVARFGAAGPVAGATTTVAEPYDAVAERERQIRR